MVSYRHLLPDPVFECDRLWYLRTGARQAVVLKHRDGAPIDGFGSGWEPVLAYDGLDPVYLLAFEAATGARATWIVSMDGRRLGDRLSDLGPADRDALQMSVRARGLALPEGLIGDGLQFIEARLRREILALADAAPSEARPAGFAAPGDLRCFARNPPVPDAASFTFGAGWSRQENAPPRAVASPCAAGLPMVPASSRRLLSVTLLPLQAEVSLPDEIAILADGVLAGTARLDPRWQRDGARYAFWLRPTHGSPRDLALEFRHAGGFDLAGLELSLGNRPAPAAGGDAELMQLFENLGDNCEFGLVQRHFAAEPVGLLRFAGLGDVYRLIRLLDDRFGNLGEPGSLRTIVVGGEYWIQDRIYGIAYHTFRTQHDSDAETVLHDNEIKTRYLARKLGEDLEDGEKIFVYKRAVTQDRHEILALHAALNQFGTSNKLFWVTPADARHQPGEVEWVSDRLLRGYLGTISLSNAHDFDPNLWLHLCRTAAAAFDAAQS